MSFLFTKQKFKCFQTFSFVYGAECLATYRKEHEKHKQFLIVTFLVYRLNMHFLPNWSFLDFLGHLQLIIQ